MKINELSERGDVAAHNLSAPSHEAAKKYFCPMCDGVESDMPGTCPKCGMALERNPTFREPKKTMYTCPMHPQIEQDHPGNCPICGMALEPRNVVARSDDENVELRDMTRRFWISVLLTSLVLSTVGLILGLSLAFARRRPAQS